MRLTCYAWLQFVGGLLLLGACDYFVAWQSGWLERRLSPTPDAIWFGVPILLGIIALPLFWYGSAAIENPWIRVGIVLAQMMVGFVIYSVLCLWYLLSSPFYL